MSRRAIQVFGHGGAEVLTAVESPLSALQLERGQVLVKAAYAGLNYIDTYFRSGLYKKPLPYICGDEGSGTILSVGPEVTPDLVGQRVAYFRCQGSYATHVVADASQVFPIPPGVEEDVAAAAILQGCTAHYLVNDCFPVKASTKVLIHAAAGGTGLLLSQLCKNAGATVLGTVGSAEKAELARRIGRADHVIDYSNSDWVEDVRRLAGAVDVVFDGVGKTTFMKGLTVLRPRGHMITFGNASGPVDPISPLLLSEHGSIVLQRPTLKHFSGPGEIERRVADVFGAIANGSLAVHIGKSFPLLEAADAQRYLESRASTGKVLLRCGE